VKSDLADEYTIGKISFWASIFTYGSSYSDQPFGSNQTKQMTVYLPLYGFVLTD